MEAPKLAIRVNGLQKSYQKLHVLKGVDFAVASGSIFALLGSNGAGKTTIVKILTTLLKPDGGTASVGGFDVLSQPARVRESISLTGQFAAVDEILTGRENLIMLARLRQMKNPRRVADDLLERFGLADAARAQGGGLLGRHAPPPRHHHEPHRRPADHLPRRAVAIHQGWMGVATGQR
jgi:ABC-2 type transport system ATP-binding protein